MPTRHLHTNAPTHVHPPPHHMHMPTCLPAHVSTHLQQCPTIRHDRMTCTCQPPYTLNARPPPACPTHIRHTCVPHPPVLSPTLAHPPMRQPTNTSGPSTDV